MRDRLTIALLPKTAVLIPPAKSPHRIRLDRTYRYSHTPDKVTTNSMTEGTKN